MIFRAVIPQNVRQDMIRRVREGRVLEPEVVVEGLGVSADRRGAPAIGQKSDESRRERRDTQTPRPKKGRHLDIQV